LVYTPLLSFDDGIFSTFYAVNMTGISVNGTAVSIPTAPLVFNATEGSGGTIFDSGTSYLSLDETIYTPVVQVTASSHILNISHVIVLRSALTYISDSVLLTWPNISCRP
jgi:hypothetical protein